MKNPQPHGRRRPPLLFVAPFVAPFVALATAGAANAQLPSVHASVSAVSDYRFRGVSYSNGDPAVQGEVSLASGDWFASLWGSSVRGLGGDGEVDVTTGWTKRFALFDASFGGTVYAWPGSGRRTAAELFTTASLPLGPATATLGATWSPVKNELTRSSRYFFGQLRAGLPLLPVTLKASAGHEAISAIAANGETRHGKWDWQLGADLHQGPFTIGAAWVGHSLDDGPTTFYGGRFRPRGGNGAVVLRVQAGF